MLYVEHAADTKNENKSKLTTDQETKPEYKWEMDWINFFLHSILHLGALAGIILSITLSASWKTSLWAWFLGFIALHGVTAGGHRLWAHKSFKAKLPFRIMLMVFQTIALLHHIHDWATDHRVHHKYVDTDSDPHNSKRGFFFCHIGWLFLKKRPEYYEKVKAMDMSDIEADPVIMFQKKYYLPLLAPLLGFIIPTFVPCYFWGESVYKSFLVSSLARYAISMHCVFLVNSVAHHFGSRPYDKNIRPVENVGVSIFCMGEGWHNFHHTFPWDYKTGEFGFYLTNTTAGLIDFMALIGWAYDLKAVSPEMIMKRKLRTGDDSGKKIPTDVTVNETEHVHGDDTLWGWEDTDMKPEHRDFAAVYYKKDN